MHAMSFFQKRGHLSAVALGRAMFAEVKDMTPARFDVLHVIFDDGRRRGPALVERRRILLTTVRARLGLARQTVWKMIERLVELGLVRKLRHPFLKRRICLELTDEGTTRIRRAYGAAFSERYPVPFSQGGASAPRHVHTAIRKDAEREDRVAKVFASIKYPYFPPHLDKLYFGSRAPKKIGREVAKAFTSFAWQKCGKRRLGKRRRQLAMLRSMEKDAYELAQVLGDASYPIYAPTTLPRRRAAPSRPRAPKRPSDVSRSMATRARTRAVTSPGR